MRIQIVKSSLFFILFTLVINLIPAQGTYQATCQTCKGTGEVTVRERVPVRKDITYTYLGDLTKTYTNVVYDMRHMSQTCYSCNGRGVKVFQSNTPSRQTVSKPSPPPPPPPTLMENIQKRFGQGTILSKITVGKDRLRVVTYRPKPNVSVNALLRVEGNQFNVLLDDYTSMYLLRDEYDRFNGLYLKDRATGKYAMADDNGRIVYRADHEFDLINTKGDIWQGTDRVRKVGDKSKREFELINYKTREHLSPGLSLNDYCACKELWTQEGLIDVELPHAVLDDRTAIGMMNRAGEVIIPPVYKEVLDCDVNRGTIRFLDDEGYVYDFDYLGRLLTPTKEVKIEECSDGSKIVHSKVLFLTTNSIRYSEEDIKLMDRVVFLNAENAALDGLIFREAGCPDENGWAKVVTSNGDSSLFLHTSGRLASVQEKTLTSLKINELPKVDFQPPSDRVSEQWFVPVREGNKIGGRLAYRNEKDELKYRNIQPSYQQIESRAAEQLMVQAPNGLWGVVARTATLKPKYEELYQINRWSYLGMAKSKKFLIHYDPGKNKFEVEPVKKFSTMRQSHFEDVIRFNRQVPHQYGDLAFRLKSYGLSPNAPMSGREIIIEQPGNQRHQGYWFTQDNRHHLVIIMGYNDYYHYELPAGTKDVADARYLDVKKGYLYIPYRVGNGPYQLIEFTNEKFKLIEDPAMQFDAVYAVPVPTDESPHTLVFENADGYFTLSRGEQEPKKSYGKVQKLSLRLLGVK